MPKTISQRLSALERKIAAYFGGGGTEDEAPSKRGRKSKAKKRTVKKSRKGRKKAVG